MLPSDITVVIPAYNSAAYLPRTLRTVAAQTSLPAEVIVVDDGSSDDTIAVAEAFGATCPQLALRILRWQHVGPGAARNAGIQAARTSWIAFLDADDLWEPEKIATCVAASVAHPTANLISHDEWCVRLDGTKVSFGGSQYHEPGVSFPQQLFFRNLLSTSAVVCRRVLVIDCGGFDESLSSAQDYELWLRLSPGAVPVFVPRTLGNYVDRVGNISQTMFWRRLINIIRVRHRHRRLVDPGTHARLLLRTIAEHLVAPLRKLLKPSRPTA